MADHEGRGGDWFANRTVFEQRPAGLQAAAEERVGRAADVHAALPGLVEQHLAVRAADGQRLLVVHRFAFAHRSQRDGAMRGGDSQVDNQFDLGVFKHLGHFDGAWDVELFRLRAGGIHVQVGACHDVECIQHLAVFQIDRADGAGADHGDFDGFGCH